MHRIPDPGTVSHTEGAPAANKRFVPEPTVKYSAGTRYNRLIERRCASLDLEAAFKQISISRNIVKQVCKECNAEFCRCPAFTDNTLLHRTHCLEQLQHPQANFQLIWARTGKLTLERSLSNL